MYRINFSSALAKAYVDFLPVRILGISVIFSNLFRDRVRDYITFVVHDHDLMVRIRARHILSHLLHPADPDIDGDNALFIRQKLGCCHNKLTCSCVDVRINDNLGAISFNSFLVPDSLGGNIVFSRNPVIAVDKLTLYIAIDSLCVS